MQTRTVQTKTIEYVDWHDDIQEPLEALLSEREGRKVNIRDYAGKYGAEPNPDAPYQDFWHKWVDLIDLEGNDSYGEMYWNDWQDWAADQPAWIHTIYNAIGELLSDEQKESLTVYYSW